MRFVVYHDATELVRKGPDRVLMGIGQARCSVIRRECGFCSVRCLFACLCVVDGGERPVEGVVTLAGDGLGYGALCVQANARYSICVSFEPRHVFLRRAA